MLLYDVCLSHSSGLSREQGGLGKGTEVAHGHHFQAQNVKGRGHQAALVGCSNHYMIYMDETMIINIYYHSYCSVIID